MIRYWKLLWVQLRASLATAMQYRADFILSGIMSLWWMVWTFVPLLIVYKGRGQIAGWNLSEALVVVAWFTLLRA